MSDSPDSKVSEQPTSADIRLAAMNLLARREHSFLELQQKLRRRFSDEALMLEVLERLREDNLLCNQRFAGSYLRQRLGRGHGPVRIRQELRERGVDDMDIERALQEESPDWPALAEQAYLRKFGASAPLDIRDKARRVRFMQYRGFYQDDYQHLLER